MADNTPNLSRLFQTAGKQNQQQGTGYTNLNRVFEANKGNVLGQSVAGNVQKQVGNVQNQLGEQQKQFQSEADKNRIGTNTDKENREAVIGRFNDPSGVAGQLSDQDVSAFEKYRSGTYAGPTALKDTASLQNTANQLRSQVSNFSPSGTQELLRRSVGGNRYTQGQQRLDSLLMDKSKLVPVQRQASTLGQQVNRADLAASGQAELYKNQAQQFANETQDKLNQSLTGIDTSVQKQLADAQAVEKDRQTRLQAIQNFTANKSPVLDSSGNPVKDQYGNIQYTEGTRGTTDTYGQLDRFNELLKGQGMQDQELQQIFGKGNIASQKSAYDTNLANINKQELAQIAADRNIGRSLLGSGSTFASGINSKISDYLKSNKDKYSSAFDNEGQLKAFSQDADQDILRTADDATKQLILSGQITRDELNSLNPYLGVKGMLQQGVSGQDIFNPQKKSAEQQYLESTGIAGKAALGGSQEQFYSNLSKTLANSQSAQNLTKQGVASQSQKANYEALSRLLGKQAADSQYRAADTTQYQAGNLLLNPEQIKKSLGY